MNKRNQRNTNDLEDELVVWTLQASDFIPLVGKITYLERVRRERLNGALSEDTRVQRENTERLLMYYHIAIVNTPLVLGAAAAAYYFLTR